MVEFDYVSSGFSNYLCVRGTIGTFSFVTPYISHSYSSSYSFLLVYRCESLGLNFSFSSLTAFGSASPTVAGGRQEPPMSFQHRGIKLYDSDCSLSRAKDF